MNKSNMKMKNLHVVSFALAILLQQIHFTVQKSSSQIQKTDPIEIGHILRKRDANCQCGIRQPTSGIVNGMRTMEGEYPWTAAIHLSDRGHNCGGAILNEEWVLTAAHCTTSTGDKIIAGTTNLRRSRNKQERTVIRAIPHEGYSRRTNENDIQLLQVDQKFDFNDYVTPICLPFNIEDLTFADERAEYAGWGRYMRRGYGVMSPILYKLYPSVLSNSECQTRGEHPEIVESMICAEGDDVSGVCSGDSGGPLVYEVNPNQFTVIGLVSYGPMDCYKVDVYTRVTSFLDWVVESTGVDGFCKPF